ncbi:anti-sigma factor [Streptomyces sp. NPDC001286]
MTAEQDPHSAIGAYVLHALPPAEEAAFENHLASCDACRQEVARLQDVTAELGAAHSAPVPQHVRTATLEAIAHIRQDRAARPPRTSGRRWPRLALAASIAAATLLAGTAAWQYSEADHARTQASQARSANHALTDVLTAPDVTVHSAKLTGGARAAVAVSRAQGRAVFTAQGLPPPGAGKTYELWYAFATGDLRPAGLVPGGAHHTTHLLKDPLDQAVAVGITLEPARGSEQPTSKPLGMIPIAS